MNNTPADIANKPFSYHEGVLRDLWIWTTASLRTPDELKAMTESIILTCHQAALVEELPYGTRPVIYSLGLGLIQVFYSIENDIVIRGYSENLPRHRIDEDSSGGIYANGTW